MGKTIKVRLVIDDEVKQHHTISDVKFLLFTYLNDPDGWAKYGYFFEPTVLKNEDVLVRLSSPRTIKAVCGLEGNLSCAELGGKKMYLNSDRWFHGAKKSKLVLEDYRQYMVTHEMGHILGFEHEKCPCKNCPAPVMMQQTKGIGQCSPNIKVD